MKTNPKPKVNGSPVSRKQKPTSMLDPIILPLLRVSTKKQLRNLKIKFKMPFLLINLSVVF